MKRNIYNILSQTGDLRLGDIVTNIAMCLVLGAIIYLSYYITHKGTIYSKKFNASLVILTILTGTVMTVIGNNIALSLGMVGALSIVRFRTAIKDTRDTVYIFWTIIVGICCGVGDFLVASIGSAFAFVALIILGFIRNDNRVLVIIKGQRKNEEDIKSIMYQAFKGKAICKVHNTTKDDSEFIYEVTSKLLKKYETTESLTDKLYSLKNVYYVNTVMQNDEASN